MDIISKDNYRYGDKGKMSKMQYCFRKAQLLPKMSLGGGSIDWLTRFFPE